MNRRPGSSTARSRGSYFAPRIVQEYYSNWTFSFRSIEYDLCHTVCVNMSKKEYVLGTHSAELQRLGLQHRLWSGQAARLWERSGFGPGDTLLDVGSGPGFAAVDLAQLVGPTGQIIAIDESAEFIGHLQRTAQSVGIAHIDAQVSDAALIDVQPGSCSGAYLRWVLCFVRHPEAIVDAVARALRPGAVFAIQEYHHYVGMNIAPPSQAFSRALAAVDASWCARGGDSNIGQRLPGILAARGFDIEDVRPLVRMARPHEPLWQWPDSFFVNFLPLLQDGGFLAAEDVKAFHDDWAEHTANPDAVFMTPPMIEIVARRH